MRIVFLMAVALMLAVPTACAQEGESAGVGSVVECGTPKDVTVNTDSKDYCNIYARRMAYIEKRKKLRETIDQRRVNYQAPQSAAIEAYNESVDEYDAGTAPSEDGDPEGSAEDGFDMEDDETAQAVTEQGGTAILE